MTLTTAKGCDKKMKRLLDRITETEVLSRNRYVAEKEIRMIWF